MSSSYEYTPYMWPMLTGVGLGVSLGIYCWRHRNVPGAAGLAFIMFFTVLRLIAGILEVTATEFSTKLFWFRIEEFCPLPVTVAGLAFALGYAGLDTKFRLRTYALLTTPILFSIPLSFTNDAHRLIWFQVWLDGRMFFTPGAFNYGMMIYGTLLAVITMAIFIGLFIQSPLQRWPVGLILLNMFTSRTLYFLSVAGVNPITLFGPVELATNFVCLIYFVALFRFRLFSILPVARTHAIEQMHDGMLVLDADTRIVDLNRVAQELLGAPRSKVIGRDAAQILLAHPRLLGLVRKPAPSQHDVWIDENRCYRVHISPLTNPGGFELGKLVLFYDISEEKRTQNKHRELVSRSLVGIFQTTPEGIILEANLAILKALGYESLDQMNQMGMDHLYASPEDRARFVSDVSKGPVSNFETQFRRADGRIIDVSLSGNFVRDESGKVRFIEGTFEDISEYKKAEEARREAEGKYKNLFENLNVGVFRNTGGPQGRLVHANPAGARIFGYDSVESVMQIPVADLYLDAEERKMFIVEISQKGTVRNKVLRCRRKDGTAFWASLTATAHFDTKGEVDWIDGIIEDITEYKKAEEARREMEGQFKTLVENLDVGVYRNSAGPQGRFLQGNPAIARIFGYDSVESFMQVAAAESYQNVEDRTLFLEEISKKGSVRNKLLPLRRKDGTPFWGSCTATAHFNVKGEIDWIDGIIEDITERKHIEEELQNSQRHLAEIIEFLPDAVMVIDAEGRITAWNRAIEKMTGVKAADILGKGNYEHAIPFYGERRPVLIDLVLKPVEEIITKYAYLQRDGDILMGQGVITGLPGGELYFAGHATALRDFSGKIVGAIETVRDVTDRKRFEDELARAKDAAESANRAKSAFLAMMSHEIRTPMNAIIGMSSLLLDSTLSTQQRDFVQTIRNSGESLLTIINDILDFSKIEAGRMQLEQSPFDVRECVESSLELFSFRARNKGLELGCLIDSKVPAAIFGDPTRVNQTLVNLIGNAMKFTEKGEIVVLLDARPIEKPPHREGHVEGPDQSDGWFELHFSVRDTGIGIEAERMKYLFHAFSQADSSTARRYGGTGLGLAISKRLTEMMGGRIWVESEPGKGSVFHFTVHAKAAPDIKRPHFKIDPNILKRKRVLAVDDNQTNRDILNHYIRSWGMELVTVGSGREALNVLSRESRFDLLVTDLQMPDMDGLILSEEILKMPEAHPLPMILLSSSTEELDPDRTKQFRAVLLKPIKSSLLYNTFIEIFSPADVIPAQAEKTASEFDPNMGKRHPLRVLLAEDNHTNQVLALALLDRLGYRADVAGNGVEVLKALQRQSYDLILMDVQMPEMDGLEATREVRRSFNPAQQPRIIALTADAMKEDRERCLAAGMDDYVSKPIQVNELISALNRTPPSISNGLMMSSGTERSEPEEQGKAPPAQLVDSTAQETRPSPDIIDASALQRLRLTLGKQVDTLLPTLVKTFINDGTRLLDEAGRALEQSNAQDLRRAAHTLKSNGATFGATLLSTVAKQLEQLGRDGQFKGAAELIEQAKREFLKATAELEKISQA